MRSKKTPKTAKSPSRGKKIGLTSAIGPKATWAVLILTAVGGLVYGSHQRLSAKGKTASTAVEAQPDMAPDPAPAPPTAPAVRAHDTATPASTESSAMSQTPKAPVTTLEGCLEKNGDTFRLKDASGADAPKARSWKSGFLKKGSAAVDVLDPSESLGLGNRVGTRVSVTGTLVDKEMRARSIHRVASSCS